MSTSANVATATPPWWGEFDLTIGKPRYWRIGGLEVWLDRRASEWRIASQRIPGEKDGSASKEADKPVPDSAPIERFAFAKSPESVFVQATLADRAIVVRTDAPLRIVGGESVVLYVFAPLWMRMTTIRSGPAIWEAPAVRPSDTWFGPSTRVGELCYAERTRARLSLEGYKQPAALAMTAVSIRNQSSDHLRVERLNLPMDHLALYRDALGNHITQSVEIERRAGSNTTDVRLTDGPPQVGTSVSYVSAARLSNQRGSLLGAFSSLIG